MLNAIKNFMVEEEGLTAVEYAVAGALVVAGLVGSFTLLGQNADTTIADLAAAVVPAP